MKSWQRRVDIMTEHWACVLARSFPSYIVKITNLAHHQVMGKIVTLGVDEAEREIKRHFIDRSYKVEQRGL